MKTILTPIDFSPVSDRVIAEAVTLAKAVGGRIVLLNIVQPPAVMSDYAPMMENIVEIVAFGEKAAAKRLAKLRAQLAGKSIPVETKQGTGAPIQGIIGAADAFRADYIVMGSHGHTALYELVVGGTSHGVLKRAKCPVLVVPPRRTQARRPGKRRAAS